jgi:hypothetical protein
MGLAVLQRCGHKRSASLSYGFPIHRPSLYKPKPLLRLRVVSRNSWIIVYTSSIQTLFITHSCISKNNYRAPKYKPIKVKQSHSTPMEAQRKRIDSCYSFMTSALDGGEWSASRPGRALPPGKGPPVPIVQGPRNGLD